MFLYLIIPLLVSLWAGTVFAEQPCEGGVVRDSFFIQEKRKADLPRILKEWLRWALWEEKFLGSPADYRDGRSFYPVWVSQLELEIEDSKGCFRMESEVFSPSVMELPGGEGSWPLRVSINGQKAPITEREGVPICFVEPGRHVIEGEWEWEKEPQILRLPRGAGIVKLKLGGEEVLGPILDGEGKLFLGKRGDDEGKRAREAETLGKEVYGLLEDGAPMWFELWIRLTISGGERVEELGVVIPKGWKASFLDSRLPTELSKDGELKVLARAGEWIIRLRAFRVGVPDGLELPGDAVASQIPLAVKMNTGVRLLEFEGAELMDVAQTEMPTEWRSLPVYLWRVDRPLRLKVTNKGSEARPVAVGIQRKWWLEENGEGIIFLDRITGNEQEAWRTDAAEGVIPEGAKLQGQWIPITKNIENGRLGVEVRERDFEIEVIGRIEMGKTLGKISGSGWQGRAEGVTTEFQLPPGWRLLAVGGVDWSSGDWISKWNLLDIFLVFVLGIAVWRLYGLWYGVLGVVVGGLTFMEAGAVRWGWFLLLPALALLRVLPAGKFRSFFVVWKWVVGLGMAAVLVPFVGGQIRAALFPQLERVEQENTSIDNFIGALRNEGEVLMQNVAVKTANGYGLESDVLGVQGVKASPKRGELGWEEGLRVVVGRGVPEWNWRCVRFGFKRPVSGEEKILLWLVEPAIERLLSVLRAAGSVLLLLVLWFDGHGPRSRREERSLPVGSRERESGGDGSEKNTGSVIVPPPLGGWVLVGLVFGVVVSAQCESAIPPDGMLEKLKERLLAPGPEFPNAASIPFAELEVDGERLKVMAEVEVATGCAVPLPLLLDGVTPLWVRVDGRKGVPIMRHEGSLWAALPKGVYRVEVDGLLGKGERWEWGFLLQPKRVRVEARGWRFSGVGENGKPDNRIFFYSTRGETDTSDGEFGRGNELDAGVVIERKVFFGSLWLMESRMKRLSGEGLAVSKSLPLMAGERVLTEGLLVEEGKMRVTLGAGERERVWVSEFMQGGGIELVMADGADWAERWGVKASCFWVVNWRGASPYYDDSDTGVGLIAWWQPEPGERLRLEVRRPEMVEGATMKVQRVERVVNIGKEVTEEELRADVEASMGGSLRVELPDGVGVDVLEVNSERLPVVVREDVINVPLKPGMGQVFIKWTKKSKESFLFEIKEGEVIFGAGVSNILTRVHSGGNRWILWAWGPRMGPAVELWAVLVLGLAGAVVLSKLPGSPLKIGEWVLLSLGLTQIPVYGGLFFVGWLFLVWLRGTEWFLGLGKLGFRVGQVALWAGTPVALLFLAWGISESLLGRPEDFVEGNGSSGDYLQWYSAESASGGLPGMGFVGVPLWVHKGVMLLWSLWVASKVVEWLREFWRRTQIGGIWNRKRD